MRLWQLKKQTRLKEQRPQIDPLQITKFDLTDEELEERVLFWIFAIQNNSDIAARGLHAFLDNIGGLTGSPFEAIRNAYSGPEEIAPVLKDVGIGKFTQKSQFIWSAAVSGVDLRQDDVGRLRACIKGFGPKTARCFIMHSRPAQHFAGLDTHIMKWLKMLGYKKVPAQTPQNPKVYEFWQRVFLAEAKNRGVTPAELDLAVWRMFKEKLSPEDAGIGPMERTVLPQQIRGLRAT